MHSDVIAFNLAQRTHVVPDLKTGDIVRVYRKIKEGDKERIQIFEGLIIRIQAKQSSSPIITVRKTSFGIGVEIMFPIHSPSVDKIEIVKKAKIRRARLYFVREKTDRELRKKLRAVTVATKKVSPKKDDKVSKVPSQEVKAKKETVISEAQEK
ncbi:MAG: 50S ribosomal protein L19 [Candidatus Moraniibacteriota bacterium]|nr:MAG: 50S ribosomal protein L19 [Candidatus Moranbacteria bacterium]